MVPRRHELPLVEVEPSLLVELEPTGSFPAWGVSLPPAPRLPTLPPIPAPPVVPSYRALPPLREPPPGAVRLRTPPPEVRLGPEDETLPEQRSKVHRAATFEKTSPPSFAPAAWSVPPAAQRPATRAAALGMGAGVALFACAFALASLRGHSEERPAAPQPIQAPDAITAAPVRAPAPALTPLRDDTPIEVSALPIETSAPEPSQVMAPAAASPAPRQERPAAPSRATPGGALLNLNSIPISNVIVDGRPVGSTPLMGFAVSPGTHSVAFVHPELGRRGASIEIGAGERKAVVVRFKRPAAESVE